MRMHSQRGLVSAASTLAGVFLFAALVWGCDSVPARDQATISAITREASVGSGEHETAGGETGSTESETGKESHSPEARTLILLVHGSGSSPREWPADFLDSVEARLNQRDESQAPPRSRPAEDVRSALHASQIVALDWEETAAKRLTAPRRGYAIGEALGSRLASSSYEEVVVIAHSVGAHVAQGFLDAYGAGGGSGQLKVVFLDPFHPRGLLSWRWGVKRFGLGADRAVNYFVRGDGVPGTDAPLDHAININLTDQVPSRYWNQTGSAHYWVARHFAQEIGVDVIASGLHPL